MEAIIMKENYRDIFLTDKGIDEHGYHVFQYVTFMLL